MHSPGYLHLRVASPYFDHIIMYQVYTMPEYLKARFGGRRLRVMMTIIAIFKAVIKDASVGFIYNPLVTLHFVVTGVFER